MTTKFTQGAKRALTGAVVVLAIMAVKPLAGSIADYVAGTKSGLMAQSQPKTPRRANPYARFSNKGATSNDNTSTGTSTSSKPNPYARYGKETESRGTETADPKPASASMASSASKSEVDSLRALSEAMREWHKVNAPKNEQLIEMVKKLRAEAKNAGLSKETNSGIEKLTLGKSYNDLTAEERKAIESFINNPNINRELRDFVRDLYEGSKPSKASDPVKNGV